MSDLKVYAISKGGHIERSYLHNGVLIFVCRSFKDGENKIAYMTRSEVRVNMLGHRVQRYLLQEIKSIFYIIQLSTVKIT